MVVSTNLISTTGSIVDVIELVSKAVRTAAELRNEWKEANLSVFLLESQLMALNDALTKVNMWVESDFDDPHHQLVMNLDRCVECCRMLVVQIEKKLLEATRNLGNGLDVQGKFKLLWKSKDIKRAQKTLDRQTNALNLLLTACNLTRNSEQKHMLERRETRLVLRKMEDDTASLFVHRDVESLLACLTRTTIRASKRSLRFDFDLDLFMSRIYDKWIRGSVKKCLRDEQPLARRRSSTQDLIKLLRSDPTRPHDALLLGDQSRIDLLNIILSGYSQEDLVDYKPRILQSVSDSVKTLVGAVQQAGIASEDEILWGHLETISRYRFDLFKVDLELSSNFGDALVSVLQNSVVVDFLNSISDHELFSSTQYFLTEARRISSVDYLPNGMDILQYMTRCSGIQRTKLDFLNIFTITEGQQRDELISYFENVTSVIFTIDLEASTQSDGEPTSTNVQEVLASFAKLTSSRLNRHISIIILFTNITRKQNPVAVVSSTDGSLDLWIDESTKKKIYDLRSLFQYLNGGKHIIYEHFFTKTDQKVIDSIKKSVSTTIATNILRGIGVR